MKHFTVNHVKAIDEKIREDLKFIRQQVKKEFSSELVGLFLVGGLGRGEGGVVVKQDKVTVVNDYDLHLITKKSISNQKLADFCDDLARSINVKSVDIFVQPFYFPFLLWNTQYGYDLKHGSFLLCGNKNLLGKIKSTNPHRKEIEKLLFIRSWCFLGPIKKDFFEGNSLSLDESFFLFQQLSKAILALEEAWLIYQKDYCSSYLDKLNRIKKYCKNSILLNYFKWATEFKLNPTYDVIKNPIDTYFEVKQLFFREMLKLINSSYNKCFVSWVDYADWYSKRFDTLINSCLSFFLTKNFLYYEHMKLKLAQILLAVAFTREGFDKGPILKACDLLSLDNAKYYDQNFGANWWALQELILSKNCA